MSDQRPSELLLATRNAGKVREFQRLLAEAHIRLRHLGEFPSLADVAETGETFTANAVLKARAYAGRTGLWSLADDSGLEVEALGGAPGVISARYAGAGASDAARMEKLLRELSLTGDVHRRARFVCVIAIADPAAQVAQTFTGICTGRIADAPRGTEGFGYDPIFLPDGYEQSFGELPPGVKASLSHRARALRAAQAFLLEHFVKKALDPA